VGQHAEPPDRQLHGAFVSCNKHQRKYGGGGDRTPREQQPHRDDDVERGDRFDQRGAGQQRGERLCDACRRHERQRPHLEALGDADGEDGGGQGQRR
jgi:hypothetical protein